MEKNMVIIKKADTILIALLVIFAVLFPFIFKPFPDGGYEAVISVNGAVHTIAPLQIEAVFEIETGTGHNTVTISRGKAAITYADCRDGLCMRQGGISLGGQAVICLPNGVVVEIQGNDSLDGISK